MKTSSTFKTFVATAIAAETTVWTPTAGKRFELMGGIVTSSVAGNLTFRDNTAGTIIAVVPVLAGAPVDLAPALGRAGRISTTQGNVLTVLGPSASTLSGTIFGNEIN